METEFEKGLHNSYMVLKNISEGDFKEDYQVRMFLRKEIKGFLSFKQRYFNGRTEICYDISLKQKLSDLFKTKKLDYCLLQQLLKSLYDAFDNAKDYLLDSNHIVFNSDYIYYDADKSSVYLCYCPFYEQDIIKSGQEFLQYLLEVLDYDDRDAVEAAYEIYRLCMKDGFHMELLRKMPIKENKEEIKKAEETETVIVVENEENPQTGLWFCKVFEGVIKRLGKKRRETDSRYESSYASVWDAEGKHELDY